MPPPYEEPLVPYTGPIEHIISIDDLNYYEYMRENGNVFRLVLDDHGRVATYSVTPGGEERIAYDNDIIPILDAFVQEHPDFSFHGAKGLVALTGYQGILGYRTDQSEQARQADLPGVLP